MRTRAWISPFAFCLCLAGPAAAQGGQMQQKLAEKMKGISHLMRESERLLLEITRVDKLAARQARIVKELEQLRQQTPPAQAAAAAEKEKRQEQLEKEQRELRTRLRRMLDEQARSATLTVQELEQLLKSLPRSQSPSGGRQGRRKTKPRTEEEKRKARKQEEKKQRQAQQPRRKQDREKERRRAEERKRRAASQAARLRQIKAWFTRLPPEEQERIQRGDFSSVPLRYRRLVREYTALRAANESEREEAGSGK